MKNKLLIWGDISVSLRSCNSTIPNMPVNNPQKPLVHELKKEKKNTID
jgi:hypothetical protein